MYGHFYYKTLGIYHAIIDDIFLLIIVIFQNIVMNTFKDLIWK